MCEIYPHTVVGQLASQCSRHTKRGRSIIGLLPVWHSLGKPKSEDEIGVRATKVWKRLGPRQISGPREGGCWKGREVWWHCLWASRWKGIWKFLLLIWGKQSWAFNWMSLKSLESSSQLAQFTDVCENLPRLQITSNTSLISGPVCKFCVV